MKFKNGNNIKLNGRRLIAVVLNYLSLDLADSGYAKPMYTLLIYYMFWQFHLFY